MCIVCVYQQLGAVTAVGTGALLGATIIKPVNFFTIAGGACVGAGLWILFMEYNHARVMKKMNESIEKSVHNSTASTKDEEKLTEDAER